MEQLFSQAPKIIEEAAKSPLGILALMILTLAVLGFVFFREASERTRTAIFVLLFLGVVVFGFAIVRTIPKTDGGTSKASAAPLTLSVEIWDVELDEKHALVAAEQLSGPAGSFEQIIQEAGSWITGKIGEQYDLTAPDVRGRLRVPADLRAGTVDIRLTPPGPFQAYYLVVAGGGKARFPLSHDALAELGRDFDVEISRPGYNPRTFRIAWGQTVEEDFTLQPARIGMGIEEFRGDQNLVASALMRYLAARPRFLVKDPATLRALREKIAEQKAQLAQNPAAQRALRASLGVEVIISGHYVGP